MSLLQTALALGLALCCAATGVGAQPRKHGASSEAASNVDNNLRNEIKSLRRKMKLLEKILKSGLRKAKHTSHRLETDLRSGLKNAKDTSHRLEVELKNAKDTSHRLEVELRKNTARCVAVGKKSSALEAEVEELRKKNGKVSDCTRKKLILAVAGGCCWKCDCKSRLRVVTISETATYALTLGGAGGGHGRQDTRNYPGGRGALVRLSVVLASGTRLGVVVGCGGRAYFGEYSVAGDGGNATIVADRSRGLLLAIAGGGGGGDDEAPGLSGRASEAASDSWAYECWIGHNHHGTPPVSRFLQQHFPGPHGGLAWREVGSRVLHGSTGDVVGTGGSREDHCGGGGGGGYNGGGGGRTLPGGGGSSFCNATAARSCALEEGANSNPSGFFILEKQLCP